MAICETKYEEALVSGTGAGASLMDSDWGGLARYDDLCRAALDEDDYTGGGYDPYY